MAASILRDKDKYTALFLSIVRITALLMPVLVTFYAALAHFSLVPRSDLYRLDIALLISSVFMAVALWQFYTKIGERGIIFILLCIYHVIASLFLIFVSGFMGPLVIFWIILSVVSNLYFARLGLVLSLALLLGVGMFSLSSSHSTLTLLDLNTFFVYIVAISAASFFVSQIGFVQEVVHSDLKKSKQQQTLQHSQLLALINSVNQAIVSTNSKGIIQIYNAATLSLLDTNQSLSGKHLDDVFHIYNEDGEPQKLFDEISKAKRNTERDDLEHKYNDGEMISLGVTCAPVRNNTPASHNKIDGYILTIRDITKSKSLEEERDEFISVVSHELRTPLTIAEGTLSNVSLLMERGGDSKKLSPSLANAHEQIIYLSKMVNDLSTLSRAERGVADAPEAIDVSDLLAELFNRYHGRAEKKGLTLNLDTHGKLAKVSASRLYLEEVLQNFLTNAIKYTEVGSVTLSAKRDRTKIVFSVKDTGIGISKSDQKKIFEKFYRSEDYRTRETSGTGLGLYVVQKLAHKLGTSVEFSSRLNHGSTFQFELPVLDET